MGKMHEVICNCCTEMFACKARLKTNMCRILIENPNSENLYMKDWVLKDICLKMFSHSEENTMVLLLCKHSTKYMI